MIGFIITKCLIILGKDSKQAQEFAEEYFNETSLKSINSEITTLCLKILTKDSKQAQEFAEEYLDKNNL